MGRNKLLYVGLLKAAQARDGVRRDFTLSVPEFNGIEPSKEASDWNDRIRLIGFEQAILQMTESLRFDVYSPLIRH